MLDWKDCWLLSMWDETEDAFLPRGRDGKEGIGDF